MKQSLPSADLQHIFDHTRDLWEELRGARLFITGGTGFFGVWMLESFLFANQQLDLRASATALTRKPDSAKQALPHLMLNPAITLHQGDVRNFKFPQGEYSHIIHAATEASAKLNTENPLLMLDTIVEGTRRTLDFAIHCNAKKFLLTSSGAVYGKQPSEMTHIPEDYMGAPDPLDPKNAYGQGKRQAEHLCALYAKNSSLEVKITRGFAFVGPYLPLDIHFAIGNFIRDAINGGPIIIRGDGSPRRSYLYAADLAIWLWKILLRGTSGRTYNVGSGESISIADLARMVASVINPQTEVSIAKKAEPESLPERYVPSVDRAMHELELKITVSLPTAIRKTAEFYKGDSLVCAE